MSKQPDSLLETFNIKNVKLRNRIVSTPHEPAYAEDGMPKEQYQAYHEAKAKGGIGMTMFGGAASVAKDSPSVFGQLDVSSDEIIPWFQQFAARIHQHDCPLICQLSHMGRRTVWDQADWLPVVAPSRVREQAHRAYPKVLDEQDIKRIRASYAAAAVRCKEGGLDGCELLHHGHLPDQFLSPLTNFRDDEYGGSIENRMRFTIEVLEAMREAVGADFVIGIRQGLNEASEGGLSLSEGVEAAAMVTETGLVDYFNANFGRIDTDHTLAYFLPGMRFPLAPWVQALSEVRQHIKVPVIHACKVADLSSARFAVDSGAVDMVGMVRAHIADPAIVNKLKAGREDDIRPCVGATYCLDRIYGGGGALCIHNAATGRESTMPQDIEPTTGPKKKVVVVGGGVAGLEAARVSAERGHEVVLFEATGKLGGQILLAARATWRKDLIGIVDWRAREMERLGVAIRWDTLATAEMVLAEQPDVVVVATGGFPDSDFVPGGEYCKSTWDVLSGEPIAGDVLIYDDNGQHQAPSCADALSRQDNVTLELITTDRTPAFEMGTANFPIYLEHFYKNGVTMTPNYRLKSVTKRGNRLNATFTNEFGGPEIEREVDHVVVERGTLPLDDVFQELRGHACNDGVIDLERLTANEPQLQEGEGFQLFVIGDAVASRNIHAAVFDALRLCKDI